MARDLPAPATSASQQRRLLQIWLSPSFPVGAYAYSHGLERAVEAGYVTDRATLHDWIGDLFTHGSIRNDLILVAAAWRAVAHADWEDLLRTVRESGAKKIYVQHRGNGALVRHLRALGLEAYSDSALEPKAKPAQLALF